jgi:TPR repeat protein
MAKNKKDKLFELPEDYDISDIEKGLDEQLAAKDKQENARKKTLERARVYCVTAKYAEAKKIYDALLAEDISDIDAYIGYLRIDSEDYTILDNPRVNKDVVIIQKISAGQEIKDSEYLEYLSRRDSYFNKLESDKRALEDAAAAKARREEQAEIDKQVAINNAKAEEERFKNELKDKAEACYQKAKTGDANAQCELGEYYYEGSGVKQSYGTAVEWFEKSALKGNKRAMEFLGDCYYEGTGVKQSYRKAEEWYKKAMKK